VVADDRARGWNEVVARGCVRRLLLAVCRPAVDPTHAGFARVCLGSLARGVPFKSLPPFLF
jgi:hypothetical protein